MRRGREEKRERERETRGRVKMHSRSVVSSSLILFLMVNLSETEGSRVAFYVFTTAQVDFEFRCGEGVRRTRDKVEAGEKTSPPEGGGGEAKKTVDSMYILSSSSLLQRRIMDTFTRVKQVWCVWEAKEEEEEGYLRKIFFVKRKRELEIDRWSYVTERDTERMLNGLSPSLSLASKSTGEQWCREWISFHWWDRWSECAPLSLSLSLEDEKRLEKRCAGEVTSVEVS